MKIGKRSERTGVPDETIRYYERIELLPAAKRKDNNYRIYEPLHEARLRFIRNCRSLDMTHEEIRSLLYYLDEPGGNCDPVTSLISEHLSHVDVRLKELEHLRQQLLELQHVCEHDGDTSECGILKSLLNMQPIEKAEGETHL